MKRGRPDRPVTEPSRYIVKKNGCWLWKSDFVSHAGFPYVSIKSKNVIAQKAFYKKLVGKIPKGKFAWLKCRNRKCVKPQHMILLTRAETTRLSKKVTKLTRQNVKEIINRYPGNESQRELAEDFGVSQSEISRIVNKKRWA